MKIIKSKKRSRLFIVLLCCAISFILISILLIFKTREVRNYAKNLANGVTIAAEVDFSAFSLYSSFDILPHEKRWPRLKSLAAKELPVESNPELLNLEKSLDVLKLKIENKNTAHDSVAIKYAVRKIYELSQQSISENRKKIFVAADELSVYWMYTYILVGVACILSILLSISAYFIGKSGDQLLKLKRQNRLLLNNSIDCIIVCDKEGRIEEFSKEAEKLFGYRASEVRKKDVSMLYFHRNGIDEVNKCLKEDGRFSGEILNKHKSGKAFTSFLSANVLYDENREIMGSMGISRDITEQKKRDDEFRHIIDNASDIIYTADVFGNFVYVNPSVKGILGYTSEELIGRSYLSLIHPDMAQQVKKHYEEHFINRREDSFYEFQVVKADRSVIWVGQNIRTVFSPIDNKTITGFHGIVRNRNERKVVELQLVDSEKKYRELFDNSSELIQSIDTNGNFLYVNRAWKETIGYNDEELLQIRLQDIIHPESKEHYEEVINKLIATCDANEKRTRYSILTKRGEKRIVGSSINAKIENNKVVSVQSFLRDITTQEETQRLLKKSEVNFRQIAETIKDVFYLYNIVDEKYEYISPNCKDILGADQNFFYNGQSHTAIYVHPEDKPMLKEANMLVDSGKAYDIDFRVIIDKKISWLNEKSFPIRDNNGIVTSNSGIIRDITNIKEAQKTIEKQNIEIGKSITYAKSIQDSSLPTQSEMASIFPESFIFYSPKDILSGDFYILDSVKSKTDEEMSVFLVADCTGHGVPGGILSLLCNSLIRESFTQTDLSQPSQALDFVREKIIKFFRSSMTKRMQDGMDITMCVLNHEKTKLYYSGANGSVVIIRNEEILEFRGNKQHIGFNALPSPFTSHEIEVQEGDCIYLFTDGYADQFGQVSDKKYSKKRLKNFLLTVHQEPMRMQSAKLRYEFFEWRGRNEQTDDVTLLGVKI